MADKEALVELTDLPQFAMVPPPALLRTHRGLLLAYELDEPGVSVVVEFDLALAHLFGWPNDEVIGGHRLAGLGLAPYSVFELLHSKWIAEISRRNQVHPVHHQPMFTDFRHFIFTFKDYTLEVVAKSYRWTREPGYPRGCLARRLARSD